MDESTHVMTHAIEMSDPAAELQPAPAPDPFAEVIVDPDVGVDENADLNARATVDDTPPDSVPMPSPSPSEVRAAARAHDAVARAVDQPTAVGMVVLAAKLSDLNRKAAHLRRQINDTRAKLKLDAKDRPEWECLRCGFHWLGHRSGVPPKVCSRCKSWNWNVPPGATTGKRLRTPQDPPPPKSWSNSSGPKQGWRRTVVAAVAPAPAPVPVPVTLVVTKPTTEHMPLGFDGILSMMAPPPPPLSKGVSEVTFEFPPPPPPPPSTMPRPLADRLRQLRDTSAEPPQPERFARPAESAPGNGEKTSDAYNGQSAQPGSESAIDDGDSDPQRLDRDDHPPLDDPMAAAPGDERPPLPSGDPVPDA